MIVIADSNLIISGLYAPKGVIATILKNEKNVQFIAPDFVYEEIHNHFNEIVKKSGKTRNEISLELHKLTGKIKFVPVENIPMNYINKAIDIVKDIDIDDTFFIALHLFKKHKIWTGDKVLINGLLAKGFDICITTAELKAKLYKK
jgi:predicted nucleic acid-binding protein